MEKLISKIEKMTTLQTAFLAILLTGVFYFTSFDDGSSFDNEMTLLRGQVAEKQKAADLTRKSIENGKKFEEQVTLVSKTYGSALEFLPTELDVEDVRKQIIQQARTAGTSLVQVNAKPERLQKEKYEELVYDFQARGGFVQLTVFLSNISKIHKLINVKKMEMTIDNEESENGPTLQLTGKLSAFRYLGAE